MASCHNQFLTNISENSKEKSALALAFRFGVGFSSFEIHVHTVLLASKQQHVMKDGAEDEELLLPPMVSTADRSWPHSSHQLNRQRSSFSVQAEVRQMR